MTAALAIRAAKLAVEVDRLALEKRNACAAHRVARQNLENALRNLALAAREVGA